jgi:hypothetical protein
VEAVSLGNYRYDNRAAWWGDDGTWINVDLRLDAATGDVLADLPADGGELTAVQYGHVSPKGHPQSGHDKVRPGRVERETVLHTGASDA